MIEIGHFVPADYDEVMALWCRTEGLTLREADSCEAITHYLACNRGLNPRRLTSPLRFVSRMSTIADSHSQLVLPKGALHACDT